MTVATDLRWWEAEHADCPGEVSFVQRWQSTEPIAAICGCGAIWQPDPPPMPTRPEPRPTWPQPPDLLPGVPTLDLLESVPWEPCRWLHRLRSRCYPRGLWERYIDRCIRRRGPTRAPRPTDQMCR